MNAFGSLNFHLRVRLLVFIIWRLLYWRYSKL